MLIGVYRARLSRRIRRNPMHTVQGMNAQARVAWVERMVAENRDITAVQTFRNSMMAASFMATTAVLLIFGILNLLANADKLGVAFHGLNSCGSQEPGMTVFKLMLIVVSFFVAFFAFALAVRGYHHAGYLINVPANGKHAVAPQKMVQVLNRASLYYMAGMCAYYFTVPLVLWMFGPVGCSSAPWRCCWCCTTSITCRTSLPCHSERSEESPARGTVPTGGDSSLRAE